MITSTRSLRSPGSRPYSLFIQAAMKQSLIAQIEKKWEKKRQQFYRKRHLKFVIPVGKRAELAAPDVPPESPLAASQLFRVNCWTGSSFFCESDLFTEGNSLATKASNSASTSPSSFFSESMRATW